MLTKNHLNYLRSRIIQDASQFCFYSDTYKKLLTIDRETKDGAIFWETLGEDRIQHRQRKVDRLNPLLELLNPDIVLGQMTLQRGLAIYNECAKII